MKTEYKELRKKLKNEFKKPSGNDYKITHSVGEWLKQCGLKPTSTHLTIICKIFGSLPYPYQELDRKFIIDYLKNNKYKVYREKYL